MGPKKGKGGDNGPSKKSQREKAEKRLEEATFGMKNKNKSSKVQNFIEKATKSVKHSQLYAEGDKAKQAKKDARQAQQLQEEELRLLFNDAISSQFGKNKAQKAAEAKGLGVDQQKSDVQDILDGISSDEESDYEIDEYGAKRRAAPVTTADGSSSSATDTAAPEEAVEVFREKTIEDIIEEQRAKLQAQGGAGTPVTSASFAAWKERKALRRQQEAEAKLKAEQHKKKGGKGLSVLSGKELFNYNASLFTDDDAAITAKEEEQLNAETQVVSHEADEKSRQERAKIMEDQERLLEVFRIEAEERKRVQDAWKFQCNNNYTAMKKARLGTLPAGPAGQKMKPFSFDFNGVEVNGYVFAVEEEEMLDDFDDHEDSLLDAEEEGEQNAEEDNAAPAACSAAES